MRCLIRFLLGLVACAHFSAMGQTLTRCQTGAEVVGDHRCRYVAYFRPMSEAVDPRIVARIGGGRSNSSVRSIAIVVGVNEYPRLGEEITAARNDVRNLTSYLEGEGNFDEVIVLENEHASKENISYFLGEYLRRKSDFYQNRTRILFAYTGHGFQAKDGNPAALALSNSGG